MERGVAPIALRIPISRVRSFTDTSMILLTPHYSGNKCKDADDGDKESNSTKNLHCFHVLRLGVVDP